MSTVVFDFDSTVIQCESLEEILAPKFAERPELEEQVRAITNLGMEGKITFAASLARRLALASPSLGEVTDFGHRAVDLLSPGMADLVAGLRAQGIAVKIVSGGLREAILPVGRFLGLADEDVAAVSLRWGADGAFVGVDENDLFSISKLAGARPLVAHWGKPIIAVGDGMTDYDLYRNDLVQHFIAFTQWARRAAVVAMAVPEAKDVAALTQLLEDVL